MKRREFLIGSAASVVGVACRGEERGGADGGRSPNVLIILVDQWRRSRWTPQARTPSVSRLAARGVSFSNHFVSTAPCSPSRACLLTGTFTKQNGMLGNCDFVEGQASLDPRIPTLGHVFGENGYRTPYRGKWHLTRGVNRPSPDPLMRYGFEGWRRPDALIGGLPNCGKLLDPLYADQCVAWLSDSKNHRRPWFLVSSLVDPHDVCGWPRFCPRSLGKEIRTDAPPGNWRDDLAGKPRVQRDFLVSYRSIGGAVDEDDPDAWRRYLDYYTYCMECVDVQIGRILEALDAAGQTKNTIVVFTSDHGEMGGSHRLRTKGNFAYEEVMNVPLIVSWPGVLPQGVVTDALASNVDVMPTLCSLAGLKISHYMPGVDLSPVLRDPGQAGGREEVLYYTDAQGALLFARTMGRGGSGNDPAHVRTIRNRRWKYSHYYTPGGDAEESELYNLADDPLEMSNLANDGGYRAKAKELHAHLMERESLLLKEGPSYRPAKARS
ncbi:MAG: sulfatase-like hydrolase/transferase [Phycisphaerae bacterium]|nr:sulfatase-like hydrolase/transferase [Phycisphaerae bacterium]